MCNQQSAAAAAAAAAQTIVAALAAVQTKHYFNSMQARTRLLINVQIN